MTRTSISDRAVRGAFEPLFDIHPRTGAAIEVFYADRALETFGRDGAGWFWWSRRRGFSPDSEPIGPFATSYAAYRDAMLMGCRLNARPFGSPPKGKPFGLLLTQRLPVGGCFREKLANLLKSWCTRHDSNV